MQFSLWSALDQPQSSPSHPSKSLSSLFFFHRWTAYPETKSIRCSSRYADYSRGGWKKKKRKKTRREWRLKYRFRGWCSFLLRLLPACSFVLPWSHHYPLSFRFSLFPLRSFCPFVTSPRSFLRFFLALLAVSDWSISISAACRLFFAFSSLVE